MSYSGGRLSDGVSWTLDRRPDHVSEVVRKLDDLRQQRGRQHWLIFDEAHHIFPAAPAPESTALAASPSTSLMITVHPSHMRRATLAQAVLSSVDLPESSI